METWLIGEDNETDEFLLRRAVGKVSDEIRLEFARDGEQVVDYLAGANAYQDRQKYPFPKLVLLDLKMPKLNGFDVLLWIRNSKKTKLLPVVVFTSSELDEDVKRAYELGANSFLVKPVSIDALIELVKRLELYWCKTNLSPNLK